MTVGTMFNGTPTPMSISEFEMWRMWRRMNREVEQAQAGQNGRSGLSPQLAWNAVFSLPKK